MFWVRRLKTEEMGSPWELSYADLMSLLMGVFVLISTMSELRPSARFSSISGAVRSAFGFAMLPVDLPAAPAQPPSLVERLRTAGLSRSGQQDAGDAALGLCDLGREGEDLVIRVSGPGSFERYSARLRPQGEMAVRRLGEFIRDGRAQIEIRGHSGDGPLPATALFRDGLDLSYQRARAAADVLTQAGVNAERVRLTAWGDHDPLVAGGADSAPTGANRRLEIVVHAVTAGPIAEKEQPEHG